MGHFYFGANTEHPDSKHSAIFAVRAGCAPSIIELLQVDSYSASARRAFTQQAIEYAKRTDVDVVVIAAYWRLYLSSELRNFRDGSVKPAAEHALEALGVTIRDLINRGKRVYVVLHIPTGDGFDPRQMIRRRFLNPAFSTRVNPPTRAYVLHAVGPISAAARRTVEAAGAIAIDPIPTLCSETICPAVSNHGEPMYRDFAHLRPSYVRDWIRYLDTTLPDVEPTQP